MTENLQPTLTERWIQENEHQLWPERSRADHGHTNCRVCGPGHLGRGLVPSQYDHLFYREEEFRNDYGLLSTRKVPVKPSEANLVSSELADNSGRHTVMVDVDVSARLIESSTPGHFHLYVDVPMTWWRYRRLLKQLKLAGVIEPGYYRASVRRKATHLRPPWKEKYSP